MQFRSGQILRPEQHVPQLAEKLRVVWLHFRQGFKKRGSLFELPQALEDRSSAAQRFFVPWINRQGMLNCCPSLFE
jgi:hypothetical protein